MVKINEEILFILFFPKTELVNYDIRGKTDILQNINVLYSIIKNIRLICKQQLLKIVKRKTQPQSRKSPFKISLEVKPKSKRNLKKNRDKYKI